MAITRTLNGVTIGDKIDVNVVAEPTANNQRANALTYPVTAGKTYVYSCEGRTSTEKVTITNAEILLYYIPPYYVSWGGTANRKQIIFFKATSSSVYIEDHGTGASDQLYGPNLFQID